MNIADMTNEEFLKAINLIIYNAMSNNTAEDFVPMKSLDNTLSSTGADSLDFTVTIMVLADVFLIPAEIANSTEIIPQKDLSGAEIVELIKQYGTGYNDIILTTFTRTL